MTITATVTHTAGQHADPVTVLLLIIAGAACYVASLYLCPTRKCPRCHGTLVTRHGTRRTRLCKHCHGTGRTRRIGATAVHRLYWTGLGDTLRERRRADIQRRRQDYTPPPDL